MARVRDVATITATGLGLKDQETIESRAYLVWEYARRSDKNVPAPTGGLHHRGNLSTVILELWPQLSPSAMHDEFVQFRKEVYAYLRATGNAKCVNRSANSSHVVWWLSGEWQKATGAVVLHVPVMTPTAAERRLTSKEAGEDREPAPVTVSSPNDERTKPVPSTKTEERPTMNKADFLQAHREKLLEEHRQLLDLLILELAALREPITCQEAAKLVGVSESTARDALNELAERGTVFVREETREERAHRFGGVARAASAKLYSAIDPVPERRTRTLVKGITAKSRRAEVTAKKGENDAKVLAAARGTFERSVVLCQRSGVAPGSMRAITQRLVAQGLLEEKTRTIGNRTVSVYRKTKKGSLGEMTPATPQSVPTPPPLKDSTGEARAQVLAAVDRLIASVHGESTDAARVSELERENALLKKRVDELEAALAPLRSLMGRK